MVQKIDQLYISNYSPLLKEFIKCTEAIHSKDKLPQPFLPVYGRGYESASTKILFMGWETRNSVTFKKFIEDSKEDINKGLYWWKDSMDEFEFIYWRSNFGKDFWSFNLRVLAAFNKVAEWKELYKDTDTYENVLSSFAWANVDSVERFNAAERNDVDFKDWQLLKDCSKRFDNPKLIFDTLQPNIVILMHWECPESLLLNGLEIEFESAPHPDYLLYYKIKNPDMHLFWIKHPIRMSYESIDFDNLIKDIIAIYNSYIPSVLM